MPCAQLLPAIRRTLYIGLCMLVCCASCYGLSSHRQDGGYPRSFPISDALHRPGAAWYLGFLMLRNLYGRGGLGKCEGDDLFMQAGGPSQRAVAASTRKPAHHDGLIRMKNWIWVNTPPSPGTAPGQYGMPLMPSSWRCPQAAHRFKADTEGSTFWRPHARKTSRFFGNI